jgi:hypothetical protein
MVVESQSLASDHVGPVMKGPFGAYSTSKPKPQCHPFSAIGQFNSAFTVQTPLRLITSVLDLGTINAIGFEDPNHAIYDAPRQGPGWPRSPLIQPMR